MKQSQISFLIILISVLSIQGQNPYWRVGGNTPIGTDPVTAANNYLGTTFLNNVPIRFGTNGFNRMIIDNGAGFQTAGRVAFGNVLPVGFAPQDRLHLHQAGIFNNQNYIRFTNGLTGVTNTDGFSIGSTGNNLGPVGEVRLEQYEQNPILMMAPNTNTNAPNLLPWEWFRLQNGTTFTPPGPPAGQPHITDGYIGLNQQTPRAHIDMITPAFQGGEEFFMAKPSDVNFPHVQMGMMNLAGGDGQFLPGVFGNINRPNQWGTALQMLGAIPIAQDIAGNPPVMTFVAGRDWLINSNIPAGVSVNNPVVTRPIFAWRNANITTMYMSANGRLRLGWQLFTNNPAVPAQSTNNRMEITAWTIDPYWNPVGNPGGNPNFGNVTFGSASGLRFTFLTSNDLVIVPNATNQINPGRVLTTDRNGDVVMINTVGQANNGLSVVNGTVQLGAVCGSATAALAALTSNREVPLNGNNFVYSGTTGSVGIGTACVPNNKLEVDNNTGPNPLSGLRLTDLAGAAPLPSNNQALSVNANGDVILTSAPIPTTFGNLCTSSTTPNSLTGNYEIPLGTFHYKFTGQNVITNAVKQDIVSVGYDCSTPAPYRFSVLEDQTAQPVPDPTYAGHFKNANVMNLTNNLGITGGVFGEARGLLAAPSGSSPINIGGVFEGFGSWSNIGVFGRMSPLALPNNFGPSRYNIGVAGISDLAVNNAALPPSGNYGVYADARNSPLANYGVYAEVPASTGFAQSRALLAVAPSNGFDFAGYFVGDVHVQGNLTSTSDQILKQNFDSIPNALSIINQLQPKTFDYKTTQYPQMSLPTGLQYGLVAQDVQSVLPAIVNSASNPERTIGSTTYPAFTYSTVEYAQLIPVLIRAVQQLSAQNHKLDSLVTALTQTVSACCSNSAAKETGINGNDPKELAQINITLTDEDVIVLDQNKPNPFAEQTTITYNVPEKYGYAQLVFKTIDGRILKTVDITKKGRGQVNVFANDLSNGLYMYSLIVDGVTVDTKKMIKQN